MIYEGNIDPVNNFYKNNQHDCQYFSIDKFNETFNQNHGLSIYTLIVEVFPIILIK